MDEEKDSSVEEKNSKLDVAQKINNVRKRISTASKSNAVKKSLIKALMPILTWVFIIIVAIIIIIGIVMFFITMPGMVIEQIKEFAKKAGDAFASWFGADTTKQIEDVDIYESLNYLEGMGYDLKGYGFLTDYVGDSEDGVKRDDNNNITEAKSEFINTYLVSDNYVYTIKNFNTTTNNWLEAIGTHIASLFTGGWSNQFWSRGMIEIWSDDGTIGKKGTYYSVYEAGGISIDSDKKTMEIKRGWGNNSITYNLDGWTGRYGMPIDFLLSVHIATMMPDLAYDMATGFETVITLLLHPVGDNDTTAVGYYKNGNDYISYDSFEEIASTTFLDGWRISRKEAKKIMDKYKIKSPDNCTGTADLDDEDISDYSEKITVKDDSKKQDAVNSYNAMIDKLLENGYNTTNGSLSKISSFSALEKLLSDSDYDNGEGTFITRTYSTYKTLNTTERWQSNYEGYDSEFYAEISISYIVGNEVNDATSVGGGASVTNYNDITIKANIKREKSAKEIEDWCKEKNIDVPEDARCSDLDKDEVCKSCREYIQSIYNKVKKVDVSNLQLYQPYISNVEHHWYRDVYFVADDTQEFVDYDYDYEAITKERWTRYETYSSNPNDGDLYNPSKAGEFVYYKFDSSKDNGIGERYEGEVLAGERTISDGEDTNGDKNIRYGSVGADGTIVVKKAVTIKAGDIVDSDGNSDLNWQKIGNKLSAYKLDEQLQSSGIQQVNSETDDDIDSNIYVDVKTSENVVQTGEGQRTETNSQIKQMFLENTYFRYDGSPETAEVITELRKKNNIDYGALSDYTIKNSEPVTIDGKEYNIKDVSGQVSLEQDSLNAFSMLENEHTLDADYIYRDFKELIVELGYYKKEELTDETPKLLQWIVPDIGSAGFPNSTIDTRENEYGTMVHSKGDIEANIKNTLAAAIEMAVNDEQSTDGNETPGSGGNGNGSGGVQNSNELDYNPEETSTPRDGTNNNTNSDQDKTNATAEGSGGKKLTSTKGITASEQKFDESLEALNIDKSQKFVSVGSTDSSSSSTSNTSSKSSSKDLLSIDEWWQSQQEMFDVFKAEGWTYAQDHSCSTFEIARSSKHTTDCSLMASWALQRVGALKDGHTFASGLGESGALDGSECAQDLLDAGAEVIVPTNSTFTSAASSGYLQPGDVLFYSGHVSIYCGEDYEKGGLTFCWDTGSTSGIQNGGPRDTSWENRPIKLIVRLPFGTSKKDGEKYTGYKGNEAVVSPVTGVLLEYDTYTDNDKDSVSGEKYRTNVDLKYGSNGYLQTANKTDNTNGNDNSNNNNSNNTTNDTTQEETGKIVTDKVGYAKILVLDQENYKKLEKSLIGNATGVTNALGENNLLDDNGNYKDINNLNDDMIENWSDLDKALYGYKEFAESYEKAGISGYVIYIDGFKCELPDEEFDIKQQDSKKPSGEKLTFDSFKKVTASSFDSTGQLTTNDEDFMDSKYENEEEYKMASKRATDKLNTENSIKSDAVSTISVNGITLIKQGTVLGRTLTDKEVVEDYGDGARGDYEDYRKTSSSKKSDKSEENEEKIVGNYLRIIMRDLDQTVIEDVSTYMKLGESGELSKEAQEYQAWPGDLEALAEVMYHEAGYSYLAALSNKFASDQAEADFEMYCMGYSVVNKLLEQNSKWYGHLYDKSRTDMSPLVQCVTSSWYGYDHSHVLNKMKCYTEKELEYAEYCLTYDCTSVQKPYDTPLSSATVADGYTKTSQGTVIPKAMCQQGGYGDGAPGQSGIILVSNWDHNNNNVFDSGDELWGVDRSMEELLEQDNVTQDR